MDRGFQPGAWTGARASSLYRAAEQLIRPSDVEPMISLIYPLAVQRNKELIDYLSVLRFSE